MGYGTSDEESAREHKTWRIVIFSFLLLGLGFFLFLYKIDACSSKPENCKDEFYEFKDGYGANHICSAGATAEVVNAHGKTGLICHCSVAPDAGTTHVGN